MTRLPDRWDIYQVDFGRRVGHEPASTRPALIVSYNELNHHTPYVTVCPITSTQRRLYECEVRLEPGDPLPRQSIIQVQLVRTLGAGRLQALLGHVLDPQIRGLVNQSLLRLFDLGTGT